MEVPLDDETLQRVYAWVDEIPLSRPKRSIARDFSDAILAAEVVAFYFPKLVQMHNYSAANSAAQKHYNWNTLNRKVLKKLALYLSKDEVDDLVTFRPGAVEHFLVRLQLKIAGYREKRQPSSASSPSPGAMMASSPMMRQAHIGNNSYSDEISSVVSGNSAVAGSLAPGGGGGGPFMWESPLDQAAGSSVGCGGSYAKDQQAMSEKDPRAMPSSSMYQVHPADQQLVGKSMAYDGPSIGEASRSASVVDASASELLQEKDTVITELRETIQILEIKVQKLEQLVRLKDGKIQTLAAKLRSQKPQP